MKNLEKGLKIIGLSLGIIEPKLTKEQEESYKIFSNPELKTILKAPKNKREYLINELQKEIKLKNFYEKIKRCEDKGHKPKKNSGYVASGQGGTRVYKECSRCGMLYERCLTSKESGDFDKMMRTPMTI
jgi:hypothetical protein